jgi:hypothetical protein
MEIFTETLKRQAFTTILLVAIAWILYTKMERIEMHWKNCEDEKLRLVTDLVQQTNKVINSNTTALERNTEAFEALLGGKKPSIHQKKTLITPRGGLYGFPDDLPE